MELAAGYTTRHGEPLASFLITIRVTRLAASGACCRPGPRRSHFWTSRASCMQVRCQTTPTSTGAALPPGPDVLYCSFCVSGPSSACVLTAAITSREEAVSSDAAPCLTSSGIIGPSPDGSAMPSSSQL